MDGALPEATASQEQVQALKQSATPDMNCILNLPFSLKITTFVFTKVLPHPVGHWQSQDIQILVYLVDRIGRNTEDRVDNWVKSVCSDFTQSRLVINERKSRFDLKTRVKYIGHTADTYGNVFEGTPEQQEKLRGNIAEQTSLQLELLHTVWALDYCTEDVRVTSWHQNRLLSTAQQGVISSSTTGCY